MYACFKFVALVKYVNEIFLRDKIIPFKSKKKKILQKSPEIGNHFHKDFRQLLNEGISSTGSLKQHVREPYFDETHIIWNRQHTQISVTFYIYITSYGFENHKT